MCECNQRLSKDAVRYVGAGTVSDMLQQAG